MPITKTVEDVFSAELEKTILREKIVIIDYNESANVLEPQTKDGM